MPRFRFRRRMRVPMSKKKIFLVSFILFALLTVQSLVYIEQRLHPTILILAKQKAEQLAKEAIADAVSKKVAQMNISNEFLQMEKDNEGKLKAINLDFKEYSRIVAETTSRIKNRLTEFETEAVERTVPLGLATGSTFLAEMGPKLPVTFVPIGSVKTRLDTKLSEAGINMVLVTVYIHVEVTLRIVIPFATDQTTVITQIPITNSLVIGDVPDYWYNNPDGKPDVPRRGEAQLAE